MRRGFVARWIAGTVVLMACAGSGCSSDAGEELIKALLTEACSLNTDCSSPLVCAFKKCHVACKDSRDCDPGQRCVTSDRPYNVCQLDDERECDRNSQCAGTQVCGQDGECRDQCSTAKDCVGEQVCTQGTCAEPSELVNGRLPVKDAGTEASIEGQPCSYVSDCTNPYHVCRSGICAYECMASRDCAAGAECILPEHRCSAQGDGGLDVSVVDAPVGAPDGYGAGCTYSTDCESPLLCRQGKCLYECLSDTDCALADHCDVDKTFRCLADQPVCQYASECIHADPDFVCINGTCRYECSTVNDCPVGKSCIAHRCQIQLPDGAADGYGAPCSSVVDCAPGLVCGKSGSCVFECQADYDCLGMYGPGHCCSYKNACVKNIPGMCPSQDAGAPDASMPDASGDAGAPCATDAECVDTLFCNGYEHCVAGHCHAGTSPCDDGNPCTADACTESTKSCTHSPQGPIDADGDQHYDKACGGVADDCDDKNPNVYTGHPEVCDQLDNNCNGDIDEGVWSLSPVTELPNSDGQGSVNFIGWPYANQNPLRPAILRRSNGSFVVVGAERTPIYPSTGLFGWQLDASLSLQLGMKFWEAPAPYNSGSAPWNPVLADSGQQLAIGISFLIGQSSSSGMMLTAGLSASGVWTNLTDAAYGQSAAWNGSSWSVVWSDCHDGPYRAWATTVDTAGTLGIIKRVVPEDAESLITPGAPMQLVMGGSHALVAWPYEDANIVVTRYVLYDKALSSILAGPFTLGSDYAYRYMTSAIHQGNSFYLAFLSSSGGVPITLVELNDTTGQVQNTVALSPPLVHPLPTLAPVGDGLMLSLAAGDRVQAGWGPADMQHAFTMVEFIDGSLVSGIAMAPVDSKNVVLAWQSDNTVKVAKLTCGP